MPKFVNFWAYARRDLVELLETKMSCFPCDRRYDNVSFTFGRTLSPVHITPAQHVNVRLGTGSENRHSQRGMCRIWRQRRSSQRERTAMSSVVSWSWCGRRCIGEQVGSQNGWERGSLFATIAPAFFDSLSTCYGPVRNLGPLLTSNAFYFYFIFFIFFLERKGKCSYTA